MWAQKPLGGFTPNFLVVFVRDIISCVIFGDDCFRDLASAEGQILPFPIDFDGRTLQHSHNTVWACGLFCLVMFVSLPNIKLKWLASASRGFLAAAQHFCVICSTNETNCILWSIWCVCSLVRRWRLCALSCVWRCFVVNWVLSDKVMCVCWCDSLVRRWRLCALSCAWRCFVVNWVESVISRRQRHRRHIMMTFTAPVVTSLILTLRLLSTSLTSVELSAGCVTTTLRCAWYVCML